MKRLQAKDLDEAAILGMLQATPDTRRTHWALAGVGERVYDATHPRAPEKVLLAKLRAMKKRRLVDGCACGCRGDWSARPHPEPPEGAWYTFRGNRWACDGASCWREDGGLRPLGGRAWCLTVLPERAEALLGPQLDRAHAPVASDGVLGLKHGEQVLMRYEVADTPVRALFLDPAYGGALRGVTLTTGPEHDPVFAWRGRELVAIVLPIAREFVRGWRPLPNRVQA